MRKLAYNRNEEIQFGRFLDNDRFGMEELKQTVFDRFKSCCPEEGHLLLIQDFSQIGFRLEKQIQGLGQVDKGQLQGFYLQPVLCLDADKGGCYGLAAVTFVNRGFKKKISRELAKAQRSKTAFEDKESYLWYSTIADAVKNCPETVRKTVVADRAADIYPVLTGLTDLGVDYVIRARHNRCLEQGNKLYEQVSTFSEQYRFSVLLPATDKRSAHTAILKVRYGQVALKKNEAKTKQPLPLTHTCWAVKVEEDSCSVVGSQAPVEWLLLTSHPVESPEEAMQVIGFYKERWNIEQVFRILKSKGLCFEQCQVKEYGKLQKLMMLALMAAVKVVQLVRARDGSSGQAASCVFSQTEMVVLDKLNKQVEGRTEKLKNPFPANSLAYAAWVIARLSGWSGYQSQKPPGPIDFLTGLQRFDERLKGYLLALGT